ncbi:MAG: hypothetical protein ABWZ26_04365 [Candidatus Nanopelagicales bacterium]
MTTMALPLTAARSRSSLSVLAWIEAKRFARHPMFLVGLGLAVWATVVIGSGGPASRGEVARGPENLDFQVIPGFLVGVFGFVVAARLTRSTSRSQEVMRGAPLSDTVRTAALCLACLVPMSAGLALVLLHAAIVTSDPPEEWIYGTYGSLEQVVIVGVLPVIFSVGGPLLGVAVGRWLRFPGAILLCVGILLFWCAWAAYSPIESMDASSPLSRVLHLLTPYTAWGQADGDGDVPSTEFTSFTGSPVWFALWALALCGLAVCAALWRGAEGRGRVIVGRSFVGLSVAALVFLGLAAMGGNDEPMVTTPDGVTRVVQSE